MNTILSLETSTESCSVALQTGGKIVSRFEYAPRKQTALVLPMIAEVLEEAGVEKQSLDYIAFGNGPGAFTGVRVCVAVAQGLAYGLSVPLVALSTLRVLAQSTFRKTGKTSILSVFDARMGQVYAGFYTIDNNGLAISVGKDVVVSPDQLHDGELDNNNRVWTVAGSGAVFTPEFAKELKIDDVSLPDSFPEAEDMLVLANHEIKLNNALSAAEVEPVYLRDNVARKKHQQ